MKTISYFKYFPTVSCKLLCHCIVRATCFERLHIWQNIYLTKVRAHTYVSNNLKLPFKAGSTVLQIVPLSNLRNFYKSLNAILLNLTFNLFISLNKIIQLKNVSIMQGLR